MLKSNLQDIIREETLLVRDQLLKDMPSKDKQHVETIDDVIFYKGKVFVPTKVLCECIMTEHHDYLIAGHPGIG